jgi:hypothetical protein
MSEGTSTTDLLLLALRDAGIAEPVWEAVDARARSRLDHEIACANALPARRRQHRVRFRRRTRPWRGAFLVPVVVLSMTAAAGAAVGVISLIQPMHLFRSNPSTLGTSPSSLWRETIIPGSVRELESVDVPGVGSVQYWTARTLEHGLCGALRLPSGGWVGMPGGASSVGGALPGCRPTRRQLDHGGKPALATDPFDFEETNIRATGGRLWVLLYGVVSTAAGQPAIVRDLISGRSSPVVSGRYFAVLLPASSGDGAVARFRLAAVARSGQVLAKEVPPPHISPPPG